MPMDRSRYPANWRAIADAVKEAAGWVCQQCGKQCRRPGQPLVIGHPELGHQATLTVAHLDHDPENPHARLAALCAPCHLRYDAGHHAATRAAR